MSGLRVSIVFLFLFLISCAPAEKEIKVGVIGPFTGFVARFGEYMRESFDMAAEEINAAGGIDGKKIKLIYEDDKCIDLPGMISALKKFKDIDKVAAVVGLYCGGENTIAGNFSTENNLFIISPGDNFGFTGKYKVNTRYLITKEASLLAEHAVKQGYKNLGILYYDNEWGQAYRDSIKSYLEEHGGSLTVAESYTAENFDVKTQLLKIKKAEPDAVVILDALSGELFQQAAEVGLNLPLLSEWEIEKPEAKGIAGPALEGVVYALPVAEETDFHRKFLAKYNESPNIVHVDSYDALMIMAKALDACSTYDPQCMIDFVTNLKDYPGAGGSMTFDKETWNFDKKFVFKTVKNGEFVKLEQ